MDYFDPKRSVLLCYLLHSHIKNVHNFPTSVHLVWLVTRVCLNKLLQLVLIYSRLPYLEIYVF